MSMNELLNLNKNLERENINKEKDVIKDITEKEKVEYNIITGEIEISNNLRQRIINSYENAKKEYSYIKGIENEKEIKNCDIFINNKKINFCYYY